MMEEFINWLSNNDFENSYSEKTLDAYRRTIIYFYDFMRENHVNELKEVNSAIIRKFVKFNKNNEKYSKSGVNIRVAALKLFFYWAQQKGYLDKNPVLDYKESEKHQREFGGRGGRPPLRLPPVLSMQEIDRLTAEIMAKEGFNRIRDAALILLALATGLRTEELTKLLEHHIFIVEEHLKVIGKGNKERVVRIDRTLCETACQTYEIVRKERLERLQKSSDYYFITNRGTPMTTNLVYQQVSYYLQKIGVKTARKGAHTLRHTAASLMLRNKMSITLIQNNFGHTDLKTTTRYLHLIAGA